jgi:hypothetical protein
MMMLRCCQMLLHQQSVEVADVRAVLEELAQSVRLNDAPCPPFTSHRASIMSRIEGPST